jgi:hypothetical protein
LKNKKGEVISVDWSEVEAYRVDRVNEFTKNLAPAVPNDIVSDFGVNSNVVDEFDDLPF